MSPTICLQCAMKALLADELPPLFAEDPEEHMLLVHPDPVATQLERRDLERRLKEKEDRDHGPLPAA